MRTRLCVVASATATLALTLTACGGSSTPSSSSPPNPPPAASPAADHSPQDTVFTQWMTAHHQQAVEAADIAKTRGASSDVRALATDIAKGQQDEITTMTGWLRSWGETVPTSGTLTQAMNGGPQTQTAMMSAEQLSALKADSGKTFDTTYLNIMLEHIDSAISSATTEEQQGTYPPAKQLAAAIVSGQTAGATQIRKILKAES